MYAVLGVLVLCLGGGFVSVLMAIGSFFSPVMKIVTRITVFLLLLGSLLPSLIGVTGLVVGRMNVAAALESVDPEMRDKIEAIGNAEAAIPMRFGLSSTLCALMPLGLTLILLVLAPSPKREEDDEA